MISRQRDQLEAYLGALCRHVGPLLDDALWEWLRVDDLTQVLVRLIAARQCCLSAEVRKQLFALEAIFRNEEVDAEGFSSGDASCVVSPPVVDRQACVRCAHPVC